MHLSHLKHSELEEHETPPVAKKKTTLGPPTPEDDLSKKALAASSVFPTIS